MLKTQPSQIKSFVFPACRQAEHDDCPEECITENHNDLSQPRVLCKCVCKCHKNKVDEEYRMLLSGCSIGKHEKCPVRGFDPTNKRRVYICNCRCHRVSSQ